MDLDELRLGATLLISAVLTAIVAVFGNVISGIVSPGYHYTIFEALALALFVAGAFSILLGFSVLADRVFRRD